MNGSVTLGGTKTTLSNNYLVSFHLSYSGNFIDHQLPVTLHHVTLLVQAVALKLKRDSYLFKGDACEIKTERCGLKERKWQCFVCQNETVWEAWNDSP